MELRHQSDAELIQNIQEGKDENFCLKEVISRHTGMFVKAVKSYGGALGVEQKELIEDRAFHIYDAVMSYDNSKKAKFSTYLFHSAKWKCFSKKDSMSKKINSIGIDDIKFYEDDNEFNFKIEPKDAEETIKEIERSDMVRAVFKSLSNYDDPRIEKIFKLRYIVGKNNRTMPWKEVALELGGLTAQRCIDIHDTTLESLRKKINNGRNS